MLLTTVTDEVIDNMSIEKAFKISISSGISNFEIRGVEGNRFPNVTDTQLDILKNSRKKYAITYSAVSPGLFKVPLRSEEMRYHREKLLDETIRLAEGLEIKKIIIFGIKRGIDDNPEDYNEVLDILGTTALKAGNRGFSVLIENEPGWWADTSDNCLRIFQDINLPSLKLNWDPGNLFNTGEFNYKPGYEKLKPYIENIHLKDAVKGEIRARWVPLGEGEIDFVSHIKDLKRDGYKGCITVETHCKPLHQCFIKSVEYLKSIL